MHEVSTAALMESLRVLDKEMETWEVKSHDQSQKAYQERFEPDQ